MKNRKRLTSVLAGILAAIMLLSLIAGLLPTRVSAASSASIQAEIDELEEQEAALQEEIDAINEQLTANFTEMEEIVAQKNLIDQQVGLLNTQIANTNTQIAMYTELIADKQARLDEAQKNYNELNANYKERIRTMEEEGALSYWSVLFKSSDFADLLDRINMVQEIAAADQRRMEELTAAAELVASAKEGLEAEKDNLEQTKTELEAATVELAAKQEESTTLLNSLRAKGDEYEAYMAEKEEDQYLIALEIDEKKAEYDAAVQAEWEAANPTPDYSYGGDTTPSSGGSQDGWVCPVPAGWKFSSPFGYRIHPIWGDWRFHYGIDMGLAQGNPIYAARNGTISSCGWNDSMGWYVWINHNDGFKSVYMHMTHFIVYAGQEVTAGEVIGYVGSTGDSTGPHLHFGITYNGSYVNPIEYIPY